MAEKKQIVFIHGAEAFRKYEDFISWLKTRPVEDPFRGEERPKSWKHTLEEELGEEYEIAFLSMPNKQNAKYEEWKIWFERHFEFIRDGVIMIGHSQGGYFLAKYFSENVVPFQAGYLFLVSTPFEPDDFEGEDGGDFDFDPKNLANLERQIGRIYILHSKDDPIVPFSHAKQYKKALSGAELVTFEDRGHFITEEFPEIISYIKDLPG